jgi:riboflavin synthase
VFTADVMRETLDRSSLGVLAVGSPVNLERPTQLGGRLGGHLVQGHVDGVGTLLARSSSEHWDLLAFSLPVSLARYVVEKGSITVDGVSLTVVSVGDDRFSVSLIPTTLAITTLGSKQPGDPRQPRGRRHREIRRTTDGASTTYPAPTRPRRRATDTEPLS